MTTPAGSPGETLAALSAEIGQLAQSNPSATSGPFTSWRARTYSALAKALGAEHHISVTFQKMRWTPQAYVVGDTSGFPSRFRSAAQQAQGLIDAAISDLPTDPVPGGSDAGDFDAQLWAFVASDIEGEHWGKAATQATLFVEDRIRRWTDQSAELVGEKLMTAVFGPAGQYRLGLVDGEKAGWHLFAMGIFQALRNAAAHRIDDRPDHRLYVLGLIGACSLLLTQLRYEHGNRFHSIAPGEPVISPTLSSDSES